MSDDATISPEEFGTAFREFLERVVHAAPRPEPYFHARLRDHLGAEPGTMPIVAEQFPGHDHPNVQMAVDGYLEREGRSAELLGVSSQSKSFGMGVSLSDLVLRGGAHPSPQEGPVDYMNVGLEGDAVLTCVQHGVFLIRDGDEPLVALIRGAEERRNQQQVLVEALASRREAAEAFLAELRSLLRQRNVYRGRAVSLSSTPMGGVRVSFHDLPRIERSQVVLPEGLLERIERHTLGTARHADRLLAAGRHLKRGILLHGPPGTGKTLTAMYLAGQMQGRTLLLLTGRGLGLVEPSAQMARMLQPATVVLEDVDLVAEQRTRQDAGRNAVLFELLNQMDGLADDADVLFVLTTNRADLLEPALASRPGRVDLAVEMPLPDAGCRSRLIDLYDQGLRLELRETDRLVEQTKGVSAAFIKELLRKAALIAAEEGGTGDIVVDDGHVEQALLELMIEGGELTRTLLGGKSATSRDG